MKININEERYKKIVTICDFVVDKMDEQFPKVNHELENAVDALFEILYKYEESGNENINLDDYPKPPDHPPKNTLNLLVLRELVLF